MENNIEYDLNIYGNLMIIDSKNQNIKVVEVPNIKKLFDEKQQLISFLEDKINNLSQMTAQFINIGNKVTSIPEIQMKILQEILDFVENGGKNE